MKFRNLFLSFLILGSSLESLSYNAIKLIEPNGNASYFSLSRHPKIEIDGFSIVMETDSDIATFEDARGIVIEFSELDTDNVARLETDSMIIKIGNNQIEAFNLQPQSKISLCDLAGRMISTQITDSKGYICIITDNWTTGTYLVNINGKGIKYYKK